MMWVIITIVVLACVVFGLTLGAFAFDSYTEGESPLITAGRYFMAFIGMPIIAILLVICAPILGILATPIIGLYNVVKRLFHKQQEEQ